MKHIVILENQNWDTQHPAHQVLLNLVKEHGCTYEILQGIKSIEPSIILAELIKCDTVLFATTWLYEDSIHSLGKLLSHPKVESKDIYYMGDDNVAYHLEKIFSLEELKNLSKHKFYIIGHYAFEFDGWKTEFDLKQYERQWQKEEEIRIQRNKSFRRTGAKVLIKDIQASGPQWSNLKKGDIVDELDCSSIDPNPARGIWVMGLEEPVKLLNSDGYDEWEFSEPRAWLLSKEFHCRGNRGDSEDSIQILADWIKNCSSKIKLSDADLWVECDRICRLVGVERRGNRHHIERRLQEYRQKYVYFRES